MNPTLVYDAGTMSTAPQVAWMFALLLAGAAAAHWCWKRWRGEPADALTRLFAVGALLFVAVTVASIYEKKLIAESKSTRVVQGPLHGLWQDRTLRAGSKNEYWKWQGFRIGDTPFVYCLNTETNYFNNHNGPHHLDLREGLQLRVHYLEDGEGSEMRRDIVRVELLH
jgi:MFS family permease